MADLRSLERALARATAARPPQDEVAAQLIEQMVAHPDAAKQLYLPELFGELAECRANLGQFDAAISAMERALAAGWQGSPDGRARIADFHLRAGRAAEAHALYAAVKTDMPDDIWLYNAAGLDYTAVGDHARALQWLTEGLELALRTGDPERLVDQLSEVRGECLAALGEEPDDLQRRAEQFQPPAAPNRPAPVPWLDALERPSAETALPNVRLAVAWFPASEYAAACARWPALKESLGANSYAQYCRLLQATMLRLRATGIKPALARLQVEPFIEWSQSKGLDSGAAQTRSQYAAVLATRGETAPWPLGRNDSCWCGSGRKYKRCCGTVATPSDGES